MPESDESKSYRLPLSPGPTLKSGWNSVLLTPRSRKEILQLAADPCDGLWTSGLAIRRYSFESNSFEIAFDIQTLTIAPVSENKCWAVAFDSKETFVVCASEEEGIRRMRGLPRDEFPYIISAAPDDTVWVRTIAKAVFVLQPSGEGWTEVSVDGIEVQTISAGSRDAVWLLGRKSGTMAIWRYDVESAGWSMALPLPGGQEYGLVACMDETVWLVCKKAGVSTLFQFADGTWIPMTENEGMSLELHGRLAAGSGNRLYTSSRAKEFFGEVVAYSVGVADRMPAPWPPQSEQESAAYEYISRRLGIAGQTGIRGEYTNQNQPFDGWRVDIHRMERPSELDEAAWDSTVEQLLDELESVVAVNNLFRNLRELNTQIGVVNATILPGVEEMVGLTHHSPVDEKRWIYLMYGAMFKSALGTIYGSLPPPYNAAAGIVSAGIFAAIGDRTQDDGSDPNAVLKLRFSELTRETAELFLRSNESNNRAQHSILSDSGRLGVAGKAIRSGIWPWPTEHATDIAKRAAAAFELYFYKSLIPTRWQIVRWKKWWVNNTPYPPFPIRIEAPKHAALWKCEGDPMEHQLCDVWVCNGLGAGTHAAKSLEPFPSEALITHLFDNLGQNRSDVFRGENGWSLAAVDGKPSTSQADADYAVLERFEKGRMSSEPEVPSPVAQFLAAAERRHT